jgi:hypothetical protein
MPNADECLPPEGSALREAFEALIAVLHERQVRYALIGGLAMLQYARVRTTDDIDLLLMLPQIAMPGLFEQLKDRGFTVDVARNIQELREGGITVIQFGTVPVDLMRPLLPAFAHILERAVPTAVLGRKVQVSSPEGLIIMKLIAMRPQDQADIRDLIAGGGELNLKYIRNELDQIMAPDDPRRVKLEAWLAGHE